MRSSLLLVACLLAAGAARAAPFSVSGFVLRGPNGFVLDEPLYDEFLEEVLGAMRPRVAGTGATGGSAGLEVALGFGWAPVASSSAWRAAYGDATPDAITPFTVIVRKGLPGGLALGVQLVHAPELELTSPSLELRWSLLEGHRVAPDIGLAFDAGAALGNPEATVLHFGASLTVGRAIPIQGLLTVGPYAGYAFRLGLTLERQIALFEGDEAEPYQTTLPQQTLTLHHGVIGLRVESRPLAFVCEAHFGTTNGLGLYLGARF